MKKIKRRRIFFYQQRAIIYLGMKHKLPCTLVAMATIKSIVEFFWYLSPRSFFAECKVTRSTVCCKAVRQYVWSPARHKMSVWPPAQTYQISTDTQYEVHTVLWSIIYLDQRLISHLRKARSFLFKHDATFVRNVYMCSDMLVLVQCVGWSPENSAKIFSYNDVKSCEVAWMIQV